MLNYDIVVVGGGPAGLAAAIEAKKNGVDNILVIERDRELGGILQQCIHNGFGLHIFKEELTGPEYAERFINELRELGIEYKLDTMVLNISRNKIVSAINTTDGFMTIKAGAIILAMGCRERTRGAINIPGTRPAGIFTAGTAQRFVNMEGYMVGKKVVILGSGDIGLIMARRMTLEGAQVLTVAELMPYSNGLTRNIVQCLDDYNIPLLLSHTVIDIKGKDRVEGVVIAKVDENRKPIPGTEKYFECDTLLLSVGLIPENELSINTGIEIDSVTSGPVVNESMETSIEGIFACGNVVHVHDLVDFVTEESRRAGKSAARFVKNELKDSSKKLKTKAGKGIRYIVPQKIRIDNIDKELEVFMRVDNVYSNMKMKVSVDGKEIKSIKKKHLAPGEMERVKINKEDLLTLEGEQIIISLEKEGA
ncbi:NAD(P)/FAD-dependent oxidoreductase [Caminicella sporogenes]|uniref:NAD(P)/FAD-dependent oxidoreductase n=1 Tax=Caminicella sporogenes TaxID=166485 RepID=UPI002542351F|nr:FAD-dependent oxidoreductase [Caminicella sporogenes]WIF93933.1 FAD-dependent oxidoreductase [Caminicella sporogenes]